MKSTNKLVPFFALWVSLVLALSIFIGQGLGQEGSTGGEAATSDAPFSVYLPIVRKPPNTLYGNVTDDGVAAAGVLVGLRFYDGVNTTTILTDTTDINGEYRFIGMAALSPGQKYHVRYMNFEDPTRLYVWETRELTSFMDGSVVNIGDFDIANVEFTSPADGTLARVPQTFQWTPRPATPNDSYEFDIFDIYDYNPLFYTAPLGYVGSYNLSSLPTGFQYCIPYFWGIAVYGPDGGWGGSWWSYMVTLYNAAPAGIHGCVSYNGSPANGVSVELRKWTGSAYTSVQTKTTNSNGYFAFTSKPSLKPEEEYYVRYSNTADSSRLWFHATQTLYSYSSGSSVHIGDFDIANILLESPSSGSTVPPTTTFSWTRRPNTPLDDYEFDLYDPYDNDPWFWTDPTLGYADHYSMEGLPSGFFYGIPYIWDIWVYDLFYGYGYSYDSNAVTFIPAGASLGKAGSGLRPDPELLRLERIRGRVLSHSQTDEARLRLHPSIYMLRSQR